MLLSHRAAASVGALLAACTIAVPVADSAVPKTTITAPPGTPSWLISKAWQQAGWLSDPHPSSITLLLGPNYKIVLRGHFVCGNSCHFMGKPPTGEVAVVVFQGHTREVGAFGLGSAAVYNGATGYRVAP